MLGQGPGVFQHCESTVQDAAKLTVIVCDWSMQRHHAEGLAVGIVVYGGVQIHAAKPMCHSRTANAIPRVVTACDVQFVTDEYKNVHALSQHP